MPSANEFYATGPADGRESRPNDEPTFVVRKLGSGAVPAYLERVLTQDGEHRFVVTERLPRGSMTEEEASECVHDARMAGALEHPNVVHTRAITVRSDEISVTSDYVAGERLSQLWSPALGSAKALPLEIALRILVDVATGLGALHKLRGADGHERVKFVHGEVTGENVLVGLDGASLLLRASRARRRNVLPKTGIGTLAPEVLAGEAADQRADIYSLGALLWHALSGRPLFSDDDIDAILATAKQGTIERADVTRHAPWALPLADVAARALGAAPEKRFPTASSMVTELRKIAGTKLATAEQVAEFVEATVGEKIAARLADVQASAVIRKAKSIPAPRSAPPEATEAPGLEPKPEPAVSASISPTTEVARPRVFPKLPLAPQTPPPSSPRTEVARPQVFPKLPLASPAPREPPRDEAVSAGAPAAKPDDRSSPSPIAQANVVATPTRVKVTPERARTARRPPVVAKVSQAVLVPAPTPSLLGQRTLRFGMGAWLAIALVTGLFIWRAIRNRQDIATPGATLVDTTANLAPAASAAAPETTNRAGRPGVLAPSQVKSAPATTSTARARPPTPSEPPKAPTTNLRQK